MTRFEPAQSVQPYVALLDQVDVPKGGGLTFCYPYVSEQWEEFQPEKVSDLGLAGRSVYAHELGPSRPQPMCPQPPVSGFLAFHAGCRRQPGTRAVRRLIAADTFGQRYLRPTPDERTPRDCA